jgi:hypothetical protein
MKSDNWQYWFTHYNFSYDACSESKDTSRVGRKGNFLCLLWQQCRRPWSFTCEPCWFDSGRTGFVWVRRVWNGSADPKSRQMRGEFRHTISQRKGERPAEIHNQIVAVYGNVMNRQNVTKWCREFSEGRTDVQDEQRSGRSSLISAGGRLLWLGDTEAGSKT